MKMKDSQGILPKFVGQCGLSCLWHEGDCRDQLEEQCAARAADSMMKKKSDRMSAGERQVWAVAFVQEFGRVTPDPGGGADAFREMGARAANFAHTAVDGMLAAQEELAKEEWRGSESPEFRRLEEMLND